MAKVIDVELDALAAARDWFSSVCKVCGNSVAPSWPCWSDEIWFKSQLYCAHTSVVSGQEPTVGCWRSKSIGELLSDRFDLRPDSCFRRLRS